MSSAGWSLEALLEPIDAEHPCGVSLEDLPPLTTLDSVRLFGQSRSADAAPGKDDQWKLPDWGDIREQAIEGLGKSKDLRLLSYLAAAVLRTDGLAAYFDTLSAAATWLDQHWPDVHPLVDDDAMMRRNALNCFADPMAVLERLRRTPVVENRQHGRFSLRDIDIAKGALQPGAGENRPDIKQVDAALAELPLDTLMRLHQGGEAAQTAVNRIDARMRDAGGPEMAPSFEQLSAQLGKLNLLLRTQVALRVPEEVPAVEEAPAGQVAPGGVVAVGAIATRQDAVRALDAVAEYFRRNEPSSPVPLLVDRAKRLVSKNFLEVLEDVAPDSVSVARAFGGLKDGE
jgi:type VI secretion system protein ImpA